MATPRAMHHHRGLAARFAAPAPVPVAPLADRGIVTLRKRDNTRRCKQRPSTTTPTTPAKGAVNAGDSPDTKSDPAPKPASKPETKPAPKPASKPAPAKEDPPKSNKNDDEGGPSYMHGVQTGQGTYYDTGLGACGITNTNSDMIAAVSWKLFDTYPGYTGGNPNNNPMCGRKIRASFGGKSIIVAATDRCTGCALTDLDFSPTAFNQLEDPAVGRFDGLKWEWV